VRSWHGAPSTTQVGLCDCGDPINCPGLWLSRASRWSGWPGPAGFATRILPAELRPRAPPQVDVSRPTIAALMLIGRAPTINDAMIARASSSAVACGSAETIGSEKDRTRAMCQLTHAKSSARRSAHWMPGFWQVADLSAPISCALAPDKSGLR